MSRARWGFWGLAAATLALYATMVFWSLPRVAAAAGGLTPFDMRPLGYSEAEARAFLVALSDPGHSFYLHVQQGLDTPYPVLLGVTLALALRWLFRGCPAWLVIGLVAIALGSAVFDELENYRVAGLLRQPVDGVTAGQIAAASRATVLKSLCGAVAWLAVLLGIGRRALLRRRAAR
jgi:hypothetical protein